MDQAINCDFIDEVSRSGLSMRRDYGFVEFSFNPGTEWVMSGASIRLHRLASGYEMAEEWQKSTGVNFPQYATWRELQGALSHFKDSPPLTVTEQDDFIEYRAGATNVSITVNNNHEKRGRSVAHGDLWSVSLWSYGIN
ncbi:hypothetical protein F0344_10160 [Streptomyces finlayi]|uniref:Uncharacterized protein n=1 Tax=Streptomyces finlayi TaxID=67296 RepID=A0A7G7BHW7_9ACTN|nr:hypothetical protein [Streptomyces finlayi]QNE74932.1 hypothetical protein F0344_10160 [Streptomyces finlayi]